MHRVWDGQRERCDGNLETLAAVAYELVVASHGPHRRLQDTRARVAKRLAGRDAWLIADHARAADFLAFAVPVW